MVYSVWVKKIKANFLFVEKSNFIIDIHYFLGCDLVFIELDEFFIDALRGHGYNLNYEELVSIYEEASQKRVEAVDRYNKMLIKVNSIQVDEEL